MYYLLCLILGIIFYIYGGYFIVIFLLSKISPFKKCSKISTSKNPFVSVIIPIRNEEKSIEKKILNTLELNYPQDKYEIIVVDSSSTDRSQEIVKSFSHRGILLKIVEHRGKAFALQKAINEFSQGEFILITDVSGKLNTDALLNGIQDFSDETIGGITCTLIQNSSSSVDLTSTGVKYWEFETLLRRFESQYYSCIGLSGKYSLFKKESFYGKKWYFEKDADDFDMSLFLIQNGKRIVQSHSVFCYEKAPNNTEDISNQRKRIVVQTIRSLIHYRHCLYKNKFGFILLSRKILPILSPVLLSLFVILFFLVFSNPTYIFGMSFFLVFLALIFIFKIKKTFLKFLYYMILLNVVIFQSYVAFLKGEDFTKWEKINSTRL